MLYESKSVRWLRRRMIGRGGIARRVRMISCISARWVTRPDGGSENGYIVFFR